MLIRDMLGRIIALAPEIWLTRYAPNPSGRVERHPLTFESKPPLNIDMFDALRPIDPDSETDTPLWHLCQASKAAWQEMYAAGVDMTAYPLPATPPTYATEAGWLLLVLDDFLAVAEPAAIDYLAGEDRDNPGEITACYRELSRLAREPRTSRNYTCPTEGCGAPIQEQPGGMWSFCDNGHQHPGGRSLVAKYWRASPMKSEDVGKALGIPSPTIRSYKRQGRLMPVRTEGGNDYYLPRDVLLVRFPFMERELEGEGA